MTRQNFNKLLPLLVLLVGLAVTYLLQKAAVNAARQAQHDSFNYQSREVTLRIEQRLAAYEQILRGARGLFIASGRVDRKGFRDYVNTLQLADQYPGIQGVGYSLILVPQEKAGHIAAVRREGFSDYTVHPEGVRDLYTAIVFLEPFAGRNLRAFGYDMYSEATRREAMEQARDLDKPAVSGKVRLLQETEQNAQAGFLMYLPVYRKGGPHETLVERRANIIGWVYAPFRMNDLMLGILGDQVNNVDLEIFDGEEAVPERRMYDSASVQKQAGAPLYDFSRCIKVAGHNWHIRLHSLPVFEANIDSGRTVVIRLAGILISLLLSLLVWQLSSARVRALGLANDMTRELRGSKEHIHLLMDSTAEGIYGTDMQGNCTFVNAAFLRLLGYRDASDIIGRNVHALIHHSSSSGTPYPAEECRIYQACHGNKKIYVDNEVFWRSDGSPMDVEYWAAPIIRDGQVAGSVVTFFDITGRKQAENKLRTLSTAIEQSPLSVVITNLDGIIQYANPCFFSTTGYSLEEAIGQNPRILKSGLTPNDTYVDLWKTLTGGREWSGEFVNKRKNGELYWEEAHIAPVMDTAGNPLFYVAVKLEITRRKLAEEALHHSEARFRTLFEASNDAVMLLDEKGFFDCNKATLELFGCGEKEEFCSRHPADFSPLKQPCGMDSRELAGQMIAAAMDKGSHSFEWVHRRADTGESFHADVRLSRMELDGRKVLQATVRDITYRKVFEEELKRSNADLEQFSYAVSHDMRQPLRMISSYLQLIESSMAGQLDGEKRGYFNFAIQGAKRIDKMLVALLEYSRVGRNGEPPIWVDSRAVLDETLQFLQPAIAEAKARMEISGDWPRILASHDEIQRLMQNLIGNAIKYRVAGRTPEISVSGKVIETQWLLCVADNGVGIIPSQIKRLFQVFQRLQSRENYEGTGIGLALCRKIAEHHNGHIWAESAGEGQGSKFCVMLPVPRAVQTSQ